MRGCMKWGAVAVIAALLVACGAAPSAPTPSPPPTAPVVTRTPAAVTATSVVAAVPSPTPAPRPIATSIPATVTPAPTARPEPTKSTKPAAVDVRSLGLGRPKADWERTYGQPDKNGAYANGAYWVTFSEDRVAHLERTWGDRDAKSKDFVMGALATLLPADKKLIGQVASSGGTPGELYRSEALAMAFTPAAFIGGEPGDFVILFRTQAGGRITSIVAAIGNNP